MVSSAKLQILQCKKQSKSFKYMLNKFGPKTHPCGTPFKRADQELKDLSIFILCQRQI